MGKDSQFKVTGFESMTLRALHIPKRFRWSLFAWPSHKLYIRGPAVINLGLLYLLFSGTRTTDNSFSGPKVTFPIVSQWATRHLGLRVDHNRSLPFAFSTVTVYTGLRAQNTCDNTTIPKWFPNPNASGHRRLLGTSFTTFTKIPLRLLPGCRVRRSRDKVTACFSVKLSSKLAHSPTCVGPMAQPPQ
jgi:hypothetical protein